MMRCAPCRALLLGTFLFGCEPDPEIDSDRTGLELTVAKNSGVELTGIELVGHHPQRARPFGTVTAPTPLRVLANDDETPTDCAVNCGDGACGAAETQCDCPQDCERLSGDGCCPPERPQNCPEDFQG